MGQPIVRAWKTLEKRRRHSDGNGACDSADSIVQLTLILVENRGGFSQILHRPLQIVHVEALAGTAESRVDVGNRLAYLLSGVFQYFTSFSKSRTNMILSLASTHATQFMDIPHEAFTFTGCTGRLHQWWGITEKQQKSVSDATQNPSLRGAFAYTTRHAHSRLEGERVFRLFSSRTPPPHNHRH